MNERVGEPVAGRVGELATRPRLTLYGRVYCHLCEEMAAALEALRAEYAFDLEQVDIEDVEPLEARYGTRVPVLCAADGTELAEVRLDPGGLRAYLSPHRISLA